MTTDPTPESVEALAKRLDDWNITDDDKAVIASTLRSQSARLAEVEAEWRERFDQAMEQVKETRKEADLWEDRADAAEAILQSDSLRVDHWGEAPPHTHIPGVKVTHETSGLVIAVDGKGQHMNREIALRAIARTLYDEKSPPARS